MIKLMVDYPHDPSNLQTIYLAITTSRRPSPDSWKAAFRDTVNGKRVVWAKFPGRDGKTKMNLWIRDSSGDRLVQTVML